MGPVDMEGDLVLYIKSSLPDFLALFCGIFFFLTQDALQWKNK